MPTSLYKLKSGKRVPGTTTIIGRFKDADALIAWSYNQGYEHASAGLPPNRFAAKEEAANIGTYTHALFEWHLGGRVGPEPDPSSSLDVEHLTHENIERGSRGFANALEWLDQTGLMITSWEQPLVSEEHAFGGTPDSTVERAGRFALGDWKTSKRLYADYLLQLAAYWILWEENFPETPITDGVHIVRFSKDNGDFSHYHFSELEREKRQFLRLCDAYADDRIIRQRV